MRNKHDLKSAIDAIKIIGFIQKTIDNFERIGLLIEDNRSENSNVGHQLYQAADSALDIVLRCIEADPDNDGINIAVSEFINQFDNTKDTDDDIEKFILHCYDIAHPQTPKSIYSL